MQTKKPLFIAGLVFCTLILAQSYADVESSYPSICDPAQINITNNTDDDWNVTSTSAENGELYLGSNIISKQQTMTSAISVDEAVNIASGVIYVEPSHYGSTPQVFALHYKFQDTGATCIASVKLELPDFTNYQVIPDGKTDSYSPYVTFNLGMRGGNRSPD